MDEYLLDPNETNRRILDFLRMPENANATAIDLANHFRVDGSAIRRRLPALEQAGYITREATGSEGKYRINLTRKSFSLFHHQV